MIYIREGEGPDDRDLVLVGIYKCPKCGRLRRIPEYRLRMMFPICSGCEVQFELLRTEWDVEDDIEEWEE